MMVLRLLLQAHLLLSLLPLIAAAAAAAAAAGFTAAPPSNILLVVVDDLGWGDVSLRGIERTGAGHSEFRTPHIDALASEGIVLDAYYVNRLCSPTRTSLMSGRYAYHLGLGDEVIVNGHPEALRLNESTIANHLCSPEYCNGSCYRCSAFGKWDIGMTTAQHTPVGRGFHHFIGYYDADEDYYTHHTGAPFGGSVMGCNKTYLDLHNDTKGPTPDDHRPLQLRPLFDETTYSTELYTREALRAIDEHDRATAPAPFFIYLAYQAVHSPLEAPERYLAMCDAEGVREPKRRVFCGMVKALDDGIGAEVDC
jgi:arylsulfatase A-like enzyme